MRIATLLEKLQQQPVETNRQGNCLHRLFYHAERYIVDFADDYQDSGWEQFDTSQDAWYFGAWVNPTTRQTLTYAEGDWTLVICEDPAHYNAEIQDMIDFYAPGEVARAINPDTGATTIYRQDRSKFLLPL